MEKYRYLKVKRFLDIILSLSGLIVLAPVFLILIAVIKIDSPGTAMFTQRRIGMGRKEFLILKFRTMRKDAPNYIPTYMLENPEYLRKMVKQSGAESTDLQSPESVDHLCDKCKLYAENWEKTANELWYENERQTKS